MIATSLFSWHHLLCVSLDARMLTHESHGAELLFEMSQAGKRQRSIHALCHTEAHMRQKNNRKGNKLNEASLCFFYWRAVLLDGHTCRPHAPAADFLWWIFFFFVGRGKLWSRLHNHSATVACFSHTHTYLLDSIITGRHITSLQRWQVFPYSRLFNNFSINIQTQPQTVINWVMSLAANDILAHICRREKSFRSERHPSSSPRAAESE